MSILYVCLERSLPSAWSPSRSETRRQVSSLVLAEVINVSSKQNLWLPNGAENNKMRNWRSLQMETESRRTEWIQTLSTTTVGTTTAYRKFIFRSGHAQNLKSWLQSAVVLSLATPHPLFWRSVDNVVILRWLVRAIKSTSFFLLRQLYDRQL